MSKENLANISPQKLPIKLKYKLLVGPNNPMFLRNQSIIKEAIKSMKLSPEKEMPSNKKSRLSDLAGLPDYFEKPWWKYGGIKVAHLHCDDKVYILDDAQWRQFSKLVLASFKNKIENASSISFSSALKISNSLEGIS